ncbi:MAG: hypothetical protein CVV24_04020 [Ignavibacteriae bacterium HGW-Ignavibacteriae-3]|nr:MAG: hypothetical protein CVV24_04020 [Ignavibacteriae bacterium HGW-Ignavibacteriae-3]
MENNSDSEKINQLVSYLKNIESRVSKLETHLNLGAESSESESPIPEILPESPTDRSDSLETQIGQVWFAKTGIVILAIGIVFLLTFPYRNLPSFLPSLVGYVLVGFLFWLSNYWKNSLQFISQYIFGGALLLLFFSTLRLHYFSLDPAIENLTVELLLLGIVSTFHIFYSLKRKSPYLMSLGITLVSVTALTSDTFWVIFPLMVLISVWSVYVKKTFDWNPFYTYSIVLVYFSHLAWFVGNPVAGNNFGLESSPLINIYFLLLYCLIYAYGNLSGKRSEEESMNAVLNTLLNSFMCFLLFLIISLSKFMSAVAVSELIFSVLFLLLSILYYEKLKSKYSTFFYAILGYTALSIAIVNNFPKPDYFVWLSWQSLVVVATALWFRSKIIIVANFIMYLIIFFTYLVLEEEIGAIALSFGVVALISARILNWQKSRLDLTTDSMRLAYLGSAFIIFPYALYHIVPSDYVGLSWTAVAIGYYVMSIILKNRKYRWMALLTFVLTVVYVLFVGTTNLDPSYRIISFIFLGAVLLVISILYSKRKKGSELTND